MQMADQGLFSTYGSAIDRTIALISAIVRMNEIQRGALFVSASWKGDLKGGREILHIFRNKAVMEGSLSYQCSVKASNMKYKKGRFASIDLATWIDILIDVVLHSVNISEFLTKLKKLVCQRLNCRIDI